MEIPLPSSFSQASALFSDTNENERRAQVLGTWPNQMYNKHLESLDMIKAVSATNLDKDFRSNDYQEAFKIYNGSLLYPFQDTAQIFHHKFDPFYWDGSELDGDYNVQENLIGTPLGAGTLEDPRMTYVENILKLKEMQGVNDPLDNSYLQNLYMVNADRGSNYYQNQLQKLNFAMNNFSRVNRETRHVPLHSVQFTKNLATGNPIHVKHTTKRKIDMPSAAGLQQSSRKQARMTALDTYKPLLWQRDQVISFRDSSSSSRSDDTSLSSRSDNNSLSSRSAHSRNSITLPTDQSGFAELGADGQSHSSAETPMTLPTMGNPGTVALPFTDTQELAAHTPEYNPSSSVSPFELGPGGGGTASIDEFKRLMDSVQREGEVTVHSAATTPSSAVQYETTQNLLQNVQTEIQRLNRKRQSYESVLSDISSPPSDLTRVPFEPTPGTEDRTVAYHGSPYDKKLNQRGQAQIERLARQRAEYDRQINDLMVQTSPQRENIRGIAIMQGRGNERQTLQDMTISPAVPTNLRFEMTTPPTTPSRGEIMRNLPPSSMQMKTDPPKSIKLPIPVSTRPVGKIKQSILERGDKMFRDANLDKGAHGVPSEVVRSHAIAKGEQIYYEGLRSTWGEDRGEDMYLRRLLRDS